MCLVMHWVQYWFNSGNVFLLAAIFPSEPGIAGYPLNSPPFLDCASFWDRPKLSMSFLTQSHQVFFGRRLSNSFNFPRYTTFDPVIIIFSFNMSKPSQPTLFDHHTQWRLSLSPDGATEPWSIFWGKRKNTRIRTHLKHILNVITLKYNSKYLIIQNITNNFPSSVFNHHLNTRYTKYVS